VYKWETGNNTYDLQRVLSIVL